MADNVQRKRKRSAIACVACHDRKVRCNAASQGIPCSNCVQDSKRCQIYHKRTRSSLPSPSHIVPQPIQQMPTPQDVASISHMPLGNIAKATSVLDSNLNSPELHPVRPHEPSEEAPPESQPANGAVTDFDPIYAGEAQGLEFLFDACSPDRPAKGLHYVVPSRTYRARRTFQSKTSEPYKLPPKAVQDELVRCFFHYVWPTLPVVDAKEFLTAYTGRTENISALLLWSVFFTGANFIDREMLKTNGLSSRKSFKEECYHYAKELHDSHSEKKKTVSIQSAILLASWYIDLEDRDGMTYWIGVAISLSFTIGLHRCDDYSSVPPCPFPPSLRRLWKCIWWSIRFREIWTAMGFGRPMRIHSEDCDVPLPTADEVFGIDLDVTDTKMQSFLPANLYKLALLWLNSIRLSLLLESILLQYYRPRVILPPAAVRDELEEAINRSRTQLKAIGATSCTLLSMHASHIDAYHSSVMIALHRPYLAAAVATGDNSPEHVIQEICSRASKAAADIATVLNDLMAADAIELSQSMLITAMMSAMQIYVFLMRHSKGLGRRHAAHQIELFSMILSHLRKTYWTADLQYNLFVEAVKSMDSEKAPRGGPKVPTESSMNSPSRPENESLPTDGTIAGSPLNTLMNGSLEEFLETFNPFMGLPLRLDDLRYDTM